VLPERAAGLRTRSVKLPEPKAQRQQAVHDLLHGLRGLEPLKRLFWSELNYDRVNQSLSRRGWKEGVAGLLADDPILFASGADAFHIIYARLASDKLLIGDERPVVSKMLQEHPYALFVFSNSKQENFHFLNVKYDDDAQKRRLFRRITVGPYEQLRTASERITLLDLADVSPELFGLSPLAIQQRHDVAFDVEPVTKEFFHEYRRIFEEVEEAITGFGRDKDRKRLYTQRLFNRLMFIAFIQKKGWLKFNGDADYLAALWKSHLKDNSVSDKNFYRDRLKRLFFDGLNTTNEVNRIGINRGGFLKTLIGDVPYLNGGLFEDDEDDNDENIKVPDKATGSILKSLFAKFNFTVTESTPLDVEVAVDPEMLGRIFEELVTGRHETGSYYTPKPIVSFMCREALKGYLETNAAGESKSAIERFVEKHEPDDLRNAENVLDALRRVKVCDPACGSGAYLLGMLHELLDLRAVLFQSRKLDSPSIYQRKLEIIQTNVYGVDIDPFAVNIARLRLWLSLAVDFEGIKPEPLPNLDYKVEVEDSLLGPNPGGGLEMGFRKQLIDEFLRLKAVYLKAHQGEKRELKKQIEKVRADISSFTGHTKAQGFDWAVEFAEVFVDGGFDIALANPPYVRMELFKEIKPVLKHRFPDVHAERADLYCYFYARAVELLNTGGMLSFISSNKWLRAKYGAPLRKHLFQSCGIRSITDFGDLPVFESATAYPMVFVASKGKQKSEQRVHFTRVDGLEAPYPDVLAITQLSGHQLPSNAMLDDKWLLADAKDQDLIGKMKATSVPLRDVIGGQILYGVKTGLNEAFVIDGRTSRELSSNNATKRVIKRFVVGKDIQRWTVKPSDRFLLYLYHGVDTKGLDKILEHVKPFRKALVGRATKQEWYELQQPQEAYSIRFEGPKIIYPDIAKFPRFALDESGAFVDCTGFALPTNDLFLLGVLNSIPVYRYFQQVGAVVRGGYLRFKRQYVENIPVPDVSASDRNCVVSIVKKCLNEKGEQLRKHELELNETVARLYGLTLSDFNLGDNGQE
jgi:type I restriction-modification system DNA methylase subunit